MDSPPSNLEEIAQLAPPLIISNASLWGLPLSDWVYVFTILYSIVGIVSLLKKYWIVPWMHAHHFYLNNNNNNNNHHKTRKNK